MTSNPNREEAKAIITELKTILKDAIKILDGEKATN
jgi:hypothetical protein